MTDPSWLPHSPRGGERFGRLATRGNRHTGRRHAAGAAHGLEFQAIAGCHRAKERTRRRRDCGPVAQFSSMSRYTLAPLGDVNRG